MEIGENPEPGLENKGVAEKPELRAAMEEAMDKLAKKNGEYGSLLLTDVGQGDHRIMIFDTPEVIRVDNNASRTENFLAVTPNGFRILEESSVPHPSSGNIKNTLSMLKVGAELVEAGEPPYSAVNRQGDLVEKVSIASRDSGGYHARILTVYEKNPMRHSGGVIIKPCDDQEMIKRIIELNKTASEEILNKQQQEQQRHQAERAKLEEQVNFARNIDSLF